MARVRRIKIDLYGCAGIFSIGEVWLTHKTDAQCTLEGSEGALAGREKLYV